MGKNLEPQYAFRCDEITIKKLEHIAKENTRTRNQEMKHIIKEYISKYEKENGEIIIESSNKMNTLKELYNEHQEIMNDPNLRLTEKFIKTYKMGNDKGTALADKLLEKHNKHTDES